MKDPILDLQGNGGGYLRTAIEMADEFLRPETGGVHRGPHSPREDTYATKEGLFEKGRLGPADERSPVPATSRLQDWDRGSSPPPQLRQGSAMPGQASFHGSAAPHRFPPLYPLGRSIQKSYEDGGGLSTEKVELCWPKANSLRTVCTLRIP